MPSKLHLIAETDEDGHVVCVWRRQPGERAAQPISASTAVRVEFKHAEFHGASREAILAWLGDRDARVKQ
jgi:hypothetical protein